jgi:hypothetical protein
MTITAPSPARQGELDALIEEARRRARRRRSRNALIVMALAGAGLYAGFGHGGGGGSGGGDRSSSGGAGRPGAQAPVSQFADAPRSQRFSTFGRCPVAPPSRYLPDRVGCLTVRRADVDGDRRVDLVLLYARLDARDYPIFRHGSEPFTLKLVRALGGSLAARVPRGDLNSTIVRARDINARPGIELLVHEYHVTTEEEVGVYSFDGARLRRVRGLLFDGADAGIVFGLSCRRGPPAAIVQHDFVERVPFRGVWDRTDTTYRWAGARLRRASVNKRKAHPTRSQIGIHC